MLHQSLLMLLGTAAGLLLFCSSTDAAEPPAKIVLIAGKKSHGPEGNGLHDYPWSVKLLKVMLDNSNVRDQVAVEFHLDGWPAQEKTLDDAATIFVISDGRDGDKYEEAPHFSTAAKTAYIERQINRGCGFGTFHFSTFAPDAQAERILKWSGAYFDWEEEGQRKWYSAITTKEAEVQLPTADHPALRGVKPFKMKEEFYYNLRFQPEDRQLRPLLAVADLPGREPDGKVVAWGREREDGSRGFGTTCGHFYDNWQQPEFRKFILNALVWSAKVEVPAEGVEAKYYTREEITAALAGKEGTAKAMVDARPICVLMLAGNAAHKWHNWERTTPAIQRELERDTRMKVDVAFEMDVLAQRDLSQYQVIVQNYVNWHDPVGIRPAAQQALTKYVAEGGGLVLVHFANGAFHFSLPQAEKSDWPEYRKLVRRVWNHHGKGSAQSGHDAFGKFTVQPTKVSHPVTAGLSEFEVEDELYFRQDGTEPIEPLLEATSKVTKAREPLAWTYPYGKGRVFQTLLGHSEKTYAAFEPGEMLRRAVAWCAERPVIPLVKPAGFTPAGTPAELPSAQAQPVALPKNPLVAGKFGKAWDARVGGLLVEIGAEQREPPLTVDLWVQAFSKKGFNIFVASEPKSSATHWELYSYTNSGVLSFYAPGRGGEFKTNVDVCDGKWHHVAAAFEPERVRLFVDGKLALDKSLAKQASKSTNAPLAFGRLVEGGIGCDALLDELRITSGLMLFEQLPDKKPEGGRGSLGIWRFDAFDEGKVKDESKSLTPAFWPKSAAASNPNSNPNTSSRNRPDHYSEEVVGFQWKEQDSVSDRWQKTDIGRHLASVIGLPEGPVRKGLSIQVGDNKEATVCYDTETASLRAWWTGGFLKFGPQRFGVIETPKPNGTLRYSVREGKVWHGGDKPTEVPLKYEALRVHNDRYVLSYRVGDCVIHESPWVETNKNVSAISRTFSVEQTLSPFKHDDETVNLAVFQIPDYSFRKDTLGNITTWTISQGQQRFSAAVIGSDDAKLSGGKTNELSGFRRPPQGNQATQPERDPKQDWSEIQLAISRRAKPLDSGKTKQFKLITAVYHVDDQADWESLVKNSPPPQDITQLSKPSSRRWLQEPVTKGSIGNSDGPLAVDTLTLPFENPYQAQMFVGGHGFFANGDLAVCTMHGDVWRVSGVDDKLEKLTWKRYATGLFQALGLAVVDDHVYVLGRDQITKLVDLNNDGEADRYENFSNLYHTSAGGHDYVTGLETDSAGNFHFVHATQGAVRISNDGNRLAILATGLRNPNGNGVGGSDVVTAAPQEGNWTPASAIFEIRPNVENHFGYGGPKVTQSRPLGYDPPLCWIPRRRDNSSGGQVWIPHGVWGPLSGQMLHLSYGQCRAMLVLREPLFPLVQGGTCELPLPAFDSGVMRGKFNSADGHLYLSGLRGWSNAAAQDGCLQRVRYTGKPLDIPTTAKTLANGIQLTFSRPLDRDSAEDVDNYFLEQWNYRYRSEYGSPDFKVSDPNKEGRDEVPLKSATLAADGRTLFLEIPNLLPVMQLGIAYRLQAADKRLIRQTIYYTLNKVGEEHQPEDKIHRRPRTSLLTESEQARLKPGVLARFRQDAGDAFRDDARVERLPALQVAAGQSPTPFLSGKPFRVSYEGYLRVPLAETYRLRIAGKGIAGCSINGQEVLKFDSTQPDSLSSSQPIDLKGGFNRFELKYEQLPLHAAEFKLYWSSESFAEEPVPPTVLFHRSDDPQLMKASELRRGRELFAESQCQRCHAGVFDKAQTSGTAMLEFQQRPPDLARVAELSDAWLMEWLTHPAALRSDAHMPQLFTADAEGKQQIADVVAYLRSLAPLRMNNQLALPALQTEQITAGELLFENLSCLACHRWNEPAAKDEANRRSLYWANARWNDGHALRDFLKQPQQHQPAIRMPDFQLTADEASSLAAWIQKKAVGKLPPRETKTPPNSERGRELFIAKGCQNCHEFQHKPLAEAKRINFKGKIILRACVAEQPPQNAAWPVYTLSREDREALTTFIGSEHGSLAIDPPAEASRRLFESLRCAACHDRDQDRSPRGKLLIEESEQGVTPEVLPNLTWAGEKLRTDWLTHFFAQPTPNNRTWLKGRMPRFPAYAATLAAGLTAEHGLTEAEPAVAPQPERVELGQKLLEPTALDCRQCHGVGSAPPRADKQTLLAPGINFALVKERVRHDYFRRFLLDPPRFDIGSRMPKLAPDGKKTKVEGIHNGDAREQFESIWHWLQTVEAK